MNTNNYNPVNDNPLKNTSENVSMDKSGRAQQSYDVRVHNSADQDYVQKRNDESAKYSKDMGEAKAAQQKYEDAINAYNNRIGAGNPYSDTNVRLPDGTTGYVNALGYFQRYVDINDTAGKNSCPAKKNIQTITQDGSDLGIMAKIDWPMVNKDGKEVSLNKGMNTGCGYEGQNVYVGEALAGGAESKSEGCYNMSSNLKPANIPGIPSDSVSYEDCKFLAGQLGKPVFALQDYNKETGYSKCLTGDNYAAVTGAGKATFVPVVETIWNQKKNWLDPGEDPNDIVYFDVLLIGSSRKKTIRIRVPNGYAVGEKPINRQSGNGKGKYFGGSGYNDEFHIRQLAPDRNGKISAYLQRTNGNEWGQYLILPIFPIGPNRNAERGLEYMRTDRGIRALRDKVLLVMSTAGSIRVYHHCNRKGTYQDIAVGTSIPDMYKAFLPWKTFAQLDNSWYTKHLGGYDKRYNLAGTSGIEVYDHRVQVTLFSEKNYQGKSATIKGYKIIKCLAGKKINGFDWNDRIRSMKVEHTSYNPFMKLNTKGYIAPQDGVPVETAFITDKGMMFLTGYWWKNWDFKSQIEWQKASNKIVMDWTAPNYSECYYSTEKEPLKRDATNRCLVFGLLLSSRSKDPYFTMTKSLPQDNIMRRMIESCEPGFNLLQLWKAPGLKTFDLTKLFFRRIGGIPIPDTKIRSMDKTPAFPEHTKNNYPPFIFPYENCILRAGEKKVVSADGRVMLGLRKDGSGLEMNVMTIEVPCVRNNQGIKTTKGNSVAAVYSMKKVGDPNLYGKIGYVDYQGRVHEYTDKNIITLDSFYPEQKRRDVGSFDLPLMPITGVRTLQQAKQICIQSKYKNKAYGFSWEKKTGLLYLKGPGVLSKSPQISGEKVFVKRRFKINNKSLGDGSDGCNDNEGAIDNIPTSEYSTLPQGGKMNSSICDRNRFLATPQMQELKNQWLTDTKSATDFGNVVKQSVNKTQDGRSKQQTQATLNTNENKVNDNIYMATNSGKIPTAYNPTSADLNNDIQERFTTAAGYDGQSAVNSAGWGKRNMQSELEDPNQRAKSISFRNVDGIVEDSKLLVDENHAKLVLWAIVGITGAVIAGKVWNRMRKNMK